jgi:hypothetical protein
MANVEVCSMISFLLVKSAYVTPMKICRLWVELHETRVMLHKQVSICCITFGTGRCWRHAGTRLSKLDHFASVCDVQML